MHLKFALLTQKNYFVLNLLISSALQSGDLSSNSFVNSFERILKVVIYSFTDSSSVLKG